MNPFAVRMVWTCFMFATAGCATYGYLTPTIVSRNEANSSCGIINYCFEDDCSWPYEIYGQKLHDVPGQWWQISAILIASGIVVCITTALSSLLTTACGSDRYYYDRILLWLFALVTLSLVLGVFLVHVSQSLVLFEITISSKRVWDWGKLILVITYPLGTTATKEFRNFQVFFSMASS